MIYNHSGKLGFKSRLIIQIRILLQAVWFPRISTFLSIKIISNKNLFEDLFLAQRNKKKYR